MPIKVEVREGLVATFPDDATPREIEHTIRKEFPPTGEEVAQWLDESPDYVPTYREFQAFEDYNKDNAPGGSFSEALIGYGEQLAGLAKNAIKSVAKDPSFLMSHRMDEHVNTFTESMAQGTAMMRQLLTESTDPDSFLFGLKAKLKGNHTQEDRYDQFLDARAFGQMIRDLDRGSRLGVPDNAPLNEEAVQLGREFADPSLAVPGLGIAKFASKPLTGAARGAVRHAGAAAASLPRAAANAIEGSTEAVSQVAGRDLVDQLTSSATKFASNRLAGAAGATEAITEALSKPPSRSGLAGRIADHPSSPKLLRSSAGAVRSLGGDTLLDAGGVAARGGLEGAAIGGALGYGNNRDFQSGAGGGALLGGVGGLVNRAIEGYSGKDFQNRLKNDVAAYRAELSDDVVHSISQMAGGSLKREADLFDMHTLATQGGDIAVRYLDKADYRQFTTDHFGKGARKTRGVTYTTPEGQPTIVINKAAPGAQIAHELLGHALTRFEETNPDALQVQQEVFDQIGSEAALKDAESYAAKLGDTWKTRINWDAMSDGERIKLAIEERAAELAEALVKGSPKSVAISASNPWRAFRDRMILAQTDTFLSRPYRLLKRFGIDLDNQTPKDQNAAKSQYHTTRINAAIRSLIRARRRTREQLTRLDSAETRVVRKQTIGRTPEIGAQLEQIGIAKRTPKGFELRSNDEIHLTEAEQGEAIVKILENAPSEGGVTSSVDEGGDKVFLGEKFSPEQVEAITSSTILSPYLKRAIVGINDAIGGHYGLDVDYFSATRRDKKGRIRYSSGIRQSRRTILPYALEVSQAGNFFVRAMDYTKLNQKVDRILKQLPSLVKELYGDKQVKEKIVSDFVVYTQNLSRPKGQRVPSEQLFGSGKRDLLQRLFGPRNPENNLKFTRLDERDNIIHSFRPDRLVRMSKVEGMLPQITEQAYQLAKENYSPIERSQLVKVKDLNKRGGELFESSNGFRAIRTSSRSHWRVYDSRGKKVGKLFDNLDDAQEAINDKVRQTGLGS